MTAADTNVVVRLLTHDDPEQFERARRLFEDEEIFLTRTVLLETEWVLRYAYRFDRAAVNEALRRLSGLPAVHLEAASSVRQAPDWHAQGLDFADALHLAAGQHAASFATFDVQLKKHGDGLSSCPIRLL